MSPYSEKAGLSDNDRPRCGPAEQAASLVFEGDLGVENAGNMPVLNSLLLPETAMKHRNLQIQRNQGPPSPHFGQAGDG